MSQKLLEAVAQNTRFRLINLLKRTQGLTVQDMADRLDMSYMGVKESCQDLERRGLLDARREPKPKGTTGRPRLIYRLTPRAHDLFPTASNPVTLSILAAAKKLHGEAAPNKLLLVAWQDRAPRLAERITGVTLQERAAAFAKARDAEGHMAVFEEDPEGGGWIREHHCPFLDVLRVYPIVAKLETDLFTSVLGCAVQREEVESGGLLRVDFRVG
jgi:predicted ArsR family transcriptional regulator